MDDFDYPYYGMEDGESCSSETESSKSGESSGDSEYKEEIPVISAIAVFDSCRLSEIDLGHYDFPDQLNITSAAITGSDNLPAIAFVNDRRRVSIHPLGVIEKPPGVSKYFWAEIDADSLFPETHVNNINPEDESTGIEHEKKVLDGTVPKAGSGGSGGDKITDESEDKKDPSEMPFLDHLEEFRWALLKSIFVIVVGMLSSWFLTDVFYGTFTRLAKSAGLPLIYTKVMEPIMLKLEMALIMGLVLALPFVFYFLWGFISPGLFRHEKSWVLPLVFFATICFFVGASISYFFVIPTMLSLLKNFMISDIAPMITIGDFIGKLIRFTLLFGIIFELPMVAFILAKIGILKHTWMTRYRKYAIVSIFIMGAVLTPPDPISQIMMAAPLILLYEISILVARFAGRKTLL